MDKENGWGRGQRGNQTGSDKEKKEEQKWENDNRTKDIQY